MNTTSPIPVNINLKMFLCINKPNKTCDTYLFLSSDTNIQSLGEKLIYLASFETQDFQQMVSNVSWQTSKTYEELSFCQSNMPKFAFDTSENAFYKKNINSENDFFESLMAKLNLYQLSKSSLYVVLQLCLQKTICSFQNKIRKRSEVWSFQTERSDSVEIANAYQSWTYISVDGNIQKKRWQIFYNNLNLSINKCLKPQKENLNTDKIFTLGNSHFDYQRKSKC